VVVFDSFSTDGTEAIARRRGARFIQRRFDDYSSQRNAALAAGYRHPWVFMLDADERIDAALADEINAAAEAAAADTAIFYLRRKDMMFGKWLRRSTGYPSWFGRLIRVGKVRFDRAINERTIADGREGRLRGHMIHYPFNKGIDWWIARHNRYSTMEAQALVEEVSQPMDFGGIVSRDPVRRRAALKQLAFRLPCRPLLAFAYLYFIRLGMLDGAGGLRYCRMRRMYEYMIDLKVRELRRRRRGLPV
jgi:glycosyltransferase involved in cell wall biosynthesis